MSNKPKKSEPIIWTFEGFKKYRETTKRTDIHCVVFSSSEDREEWDFYRRANHLDELEKAYDALKQENEELRRALAFTLRGLEMYKTYRSPGNIAEIETTIRAALKNGGGE